MINKRDGKLDIYIYLFKFYFFSLNYGQNKNSRLMEKRIAKTLHCCFNIDSTSYGDSSNMKWEIPLSIYSRFFIPYPFEW